MKTSQIDLKIDMRVDLGEFSSKSVSPRLHMARGSLNRQFLRLRRKLLFNLVLSGSIFKRATLKYQYESVALLSVTFFRNQRENEKKLRSHEIIDRKF